MNCNERISPLTSYLLDTISLYSHTLTRKINYHIRNLFNHVRLVIVVQWQYCNQLIIEERISNNVWRVLLYLMQIFVNLYKSICKFYECIYIIFIYESHDYECMYTIFIIHVSLTTIYSQSLSDL